MIKAIIFDCDGVLVDSEIVGLEETVKFMAGHGFTWSGADIIRLFTGMRQDKLVEGLHAEYTRILGRTPSDAEIGVIFQGLVDARRNNRHTMKAVPGTGEMVEAVLRLDFAMAVASSSKTEFLEDKLKRYDLWDCFAPHVYSADRVAHGKPEPDIFLYTAEQLNIAPEHCLVIEDSANGVAAGVAAGMPVWGFTGGGHCFGGHDKGLLAAGAVDVKANHAELVQAISALS